MKLPIYLDYAATTPVDPVVAELMMHHLTLDGVFANPASRSHFYGWQAESAVEEARRQVADLVNADPREIVWTSGATESDNLAIKGVAEARASEGRHIITSAIEHKAVLDSCRYLEQQGFSVTYLRPDQSGIIQPEQVVQALKPDTILVSIMHVNNELGVINDLAQLGKVVRDHGALFHVDAAQSAGKLPIDLKTLPVDLMSFSAHKIYGPKGVGALYVRRDPSVCVVAQMHGGGHERGMRSGTLPTHQLVGMGKAFALASERLEAESRRLRQLRDLLWDSLASLPDVYLNGSAESRIPGILNVAFGGVNGETMMMALRDIAISSGSACTSASVDPSYVLKAIGLDDALALASFRFSLGRFTTEEEIRHTIALVERVLTELRAR